ncbi:hypothetical protein [Thermosulfurimonas sp. F29]|uniref:hypothetical protein n=1 Tax=Thermosulfurimonas sp. F29 TaxID=2867247 RepID=UPI001C83ADBA|nr:hypothetical protein [Thermosulfurimonas sp. F29]MBX6423108.1 hypothetical protein [Thermosulfurimonas sp. F29]
MRCVGGEGPSRGETLSEDFAEAGFRGEDPDPERFLARFSEVRDRDLFSGDGVPPEGGPVSGRRGFGLREVGGEIGGFRRRRILFGGEGERRRWSDFRDFGFDERWRDPEDGREGEG